MQGFFPRLLGVFGISAVFGAIAWFLDKALFLRQEGLSPELLTRLDGDPARAEAYLSEIGGDVLTVITASLLISAVLAGIWLFGVYRNPPIGDRNARSRRGSWAAFLVVALAAVLVLSWLRIIGAPTADMLAPGVPVETVLVTAVAVLLSYWLSTALLCPAAVKVAVPGAGLIGR